MLAASHAAGKLKSTMHSPHTLWLNVLEQPVHIEFAGNAAAAAHAREQAINTWGELVIPDGSAPPSGTATRPAPDPLVFTLTSTDDIEHLLDQLSSRATLAGIEARSGELLMLHAAGLADPHSGRVVACVAPSGTGKTTLSRAAAGKLLYVTDETVAVTRSGAIVRYPKPLSVKQDGARWAPKSQHHPHTFGLEIAGSSGLTLGAVVLLTRDRNTSDGSSPQPGRAAGGLGGGGAGVGVAGAGAAAATARPVLEDVDLFDAIVELVSELSYLSRMPEPLHWLADTLLSVGGVRRLRYREAEHAITVLRDLLRDDARSSAGVDPGGAGADPVLAGVVSDAGAADPVSVGVDPGSAGADPVSVGAVSDAGAADPVTVSRAEATRWRNALKQHTNSRELASDSPFAAAATAIDDMLIDPDTGRVLVFGGNNVYLISAIAGATMLAAGAGLSLPELREYLIELFGDPGVGPAGVEPAGVAPAGVDPFAEVVRVLVEHGLLAPSASTSSSTSPSTSTSTPASSSTSPSTSSSTSSSTSTSPSD